MVSRQGNACEQWPMHIADPGNPCPCKIRLQRMVVSKTMRSECQISLANVDRGIAGLSAFVPMLIGASISISRFANAPGDALPTDNINQHFDPSFPVDDIANRVSLFGGRIRCRSKRPDSGRKHDHRCGRTIGQESHCPRAEAMLR